jgi:hypothetical protein
MNYDAAQMNTENNNNIIPQEVSEALHKYAFKALQYDYFDEFDLYYGNDKLGIQKNEKEAIELSKRKVLNYLQNLNPAQIGDVEQRFIGLLQGNDENIRKVVDEIIEFELVKAFGD